MKSKQMILYAGILTSTLITGLMIGCDSGNSTGQGRLNLHITDAPVDGADNVWIEFTGVEIKAGSETIDITYDAPKTIDLLALTAGAAELIVDDQVLPAGQVEWIRLKVTEANSTIIVDGIQHNLQIPSGEQNGLKLNRPITIPENGVATFTIDFDLRKSVHQNSNGYTLRPTLRLIDNSTDGALQGSFMTGYCKNINNAAVYVYEGTGVTANDLGSASEPVTTARVTLVDPLAAIASYKYTVAFLPAGNYTVAYTCDASIDTLESGDEVQFISTSNVTIVAGQTAVNNFELREM